MAILDLSQIGPPRQDLLTVCLEHALVRAAFEHYRASGSPAEYEDLITNLGINPEAYSPFSLFRVHGVFSPQVQVPLRATKLGFYDGFNTFCVMSTLHGLDKHIDLITPEMIEILKYGSPSLARKFYLATRPHDDSLAQQLVILDRFKKDELRGAGYYVPRILDRHNYRIVELMYLDYLQNNT